MASVVIIPPENLRGIYADNRRWARQYVAADSTNRSLVQLSASTPAAVVEATSTAAAAAGADGQIVYAVGHGGAGGDAQSGQVDLTPNRAFRVSMFLAYFDDKTETWRGASVPAMQRELREARAGSRRGRRSRERAWCGRHIADACRVAQVSQLQSLQPHYQQLAEVFREHPVRRIVLMTCNVGNAQDFLNELATDLGVSVKAYSERVMSRTYREGRRRRVRMFLEGDPEGQGTNIPLAETELMPHVDRSKVRYGRVRRARRRATRRSRVPVVPGD